jgi:gliding motility-associated-like protein
MCRVEFPPTFSPGSNGKHCLFKPRIINANGDVFFNMIISDPEGKVVYEAYCPNDAWDGTFQGKPCPKGKYHYRASILESAEHPSRQFLQDGCVSLMR